MSSRDRLRFAIATSSIEKSYADRYLQSLSTDAKQKLIVGWLRDFGAQLRLIAQCASAVLQVVDENAEPEAVGHLLVTQFADQKVSLSVKNIPYLGELLAEGQTDTKTFLHTLRLLEQLD